MNIVLVVIDTLRYDHLGANGNGWISTPNFDVFAADATVFDNSYLASFPTIPHRTDVITGEYGAPVHPWLPLAFDRATLPRTLADAGYATQLLCDTPHLVNGGHCFDYPFHAWHFVRGNEVDRHWLDDRSSELSPEQHARYVGPNSRFSPTAMQYIRNNRRRAREEEWPSPQLFATACRWLEDNARRDNFLLWIDCFDPHEPWDPPEHYIEMYDPSLRDTGDLGILMGWEGRGTASLSPEQLTRMRAHYAGEVSMVDAWFGRMLERLETLGLSDNTAVVVTSDHGTNLGAHGALHKCVPIWEQVGHTLLMARVPGKPGVRRSEIIQPQDIFPTLCDLADAPVPDSVEGHSFAPMLGNTRPHDWPREVAVSSGVLNLRADKLPPITVQDGEWCLIDSLDPAARELYHMPSDREQETNVVADHPDVVADLHDKLVAELKARRAPQALTDWLATGTKGTVPEAYRLRAPYLDAYTQYWNGILPEEEYP